MVFAVFESQKNPKLPPLKKPLKYDNSGTQNCLLIIFSFSPKDSLSLQIKPLPVAELTV